MNPRDYNYQASDMARFKLEVLLCNAIILALFAYFIGTGEHLWLCLILLNISLVRWMLAVHELFHHCHSEQLHPLIRSFLIPFSPLNIGYAEYQQLHAGHHAHTASEQDPDAFHIRGGHLRSLLGALRFPEQCSLHYVRQQAGGYRPDAAVLARLSLFVLLAWWGGMAFWIMWLALRINYGIAVWVFFHHLHYRQQQYGTFELPLPMLLQRGLALLYGKPALLATMHHDVHHQWPKAAAWHLPTLRPLLIAIRDGASSDPTTHQSGPRTVPASAGTRAAAASAQAKSAD
ncbi:MAG: fatty acid desaturase [Gammaproteobacteria bacterium]|nr:fatty acid desaturase [Gammaproteobacteria bacterium]